MIAGALIFLVAGAGDLSGDLGATWPIAEPDALAEIETAASGKTVTLNDFGDSDRWRATASVLLPFARDHRLRAVTPFFTLPFDIPDKDGLILYPKGFTFNPLEHLTLPNALYVVRAEHLDWAFETAAPGDMVILSGGNALKETNRRGRPVYLLEEKLRERLGLEAAPARVWQEGAQFKIREFAVDDENEIVAVGPEDEDVQ